MPDLFSEDTPAEEFSLPGDPTPPDQPQAEAEPEAPEVEAQEVVEESERPRDESGRFVSTKESAEESAEEPEGEAPPSLILGRYRSYEELERAHAELDNFAGRQAAELGQLREAVEQLRQAHATPRPTYNLDELVAENPAAAAQTALESGDRAAYERVLREWEDLDPAQATMWRQLKAAEYRAYQAEQQALQVQAPVQAQQRDQAIATAWSTLASEYADLEEFRPAITQEAQRLADAAGRNIVTELLATGDAQQIKEVFETLYHRARGRGGTVLAERAKEAARAHSEETARAKAEAVVASTAQTGEGPEPSSVDRLAAMWAEDEEPFVKGWNI